MCSCSSRAKSICQSLLTKSVFMCSTLDNDFPELVDQLRTCVNFAWYSGLAASRGPIMSVTYRHVCHLFPCPVSVIKVDEDCSATPAKCVTRAACDSGATDLCKCVTDSTANVAKTACGECFSGIV